MSSINIGENFLAGLRAPYYANGRMLTAEDLKADQEAFLARLGFTGEGIGAGVVRGLEVAKVANNLRVSAGLGINRGGQAVRLVEERVELSLTKLPEESGVTAGDGRFNDCNVAPADGGTLVESGVYLLVIAPVSQLQGSVSVKTISTNTSSCASRWEVEGVQFKALRLAGAPVRTNSNAGTYRNLLAHWCFGTQALATLPQDPFSFPARYATLDLMSEDDLGPCDLPLAVFYWDNQVLRIVDQWPVRRRVTQPFPAEQWHAMIADRRVADAQARFLQFQAQVEEMRGDSANFPDLSKRYGGQDFRFLPPVGFLPIVFSAGMLRNLVLTAARSLPGNERELSNNIVDDVVENLASRFPAGRAFDLATFFGAKLPHRIGLADRETIDFRLNQSWYDDVLDFTRLPDVDSRGDETVFDLLLVSDELNALTSGLLKLRLDLLNDSDVRELGATIRRFNAKAIYSAGKYTVGFGDIQGYRRVIDSTRRKTQAKAAAADIDSVIDLTNEADVVGFVEAAKLPPQYAVFVKKVRETSWIERNFDNR
jgi:hypothetical protein